MDKTGLSWEEAGGALTALGGAILAFRKLMQWAAGWQDRRLAREAERLTQWQASLDRREHEQRVQMQTEIDELRAEVELQGRQLADQTAVNHLTRMALAEVTAELERHAPDSQALQRAQALLHRVTPDVVVPTGLTPLLREIDERRPS